MPLSSQQQRRARTRRLWIAGGLMAAGWVIVGTWACPGPPARSRAWRNADNPPAVAEILATKAPPPQREADSPAASSASLRVWLAADPVTFDPLRRPTVATGRVVMGTIFEPLLRFAPVASGCGGRYQPVLATAWHIAAGGRLVTFDLRAGPRFHDGTPVTAADVAFSVDRARGPGAPPALRRILASIERVTATADPPGLKIWLKRTDGGVLRGLAEVPIMPAHAYGGSAPKTAVGSGPYRMMTWDGHLAHLVRQPGYWGKKPSFAAIDFVYEPDAARAMVLARTGQLDIIPALIAAHYPGQQTAPRVASRFSPLALSPATVRYLLPNTAAAPLSDARVRMAVALLVPREAIAEVFGRAGWRPMATLAWPSGPLCGDGHGGISQDPARAAALLDAAGFGDDDGDGRRYRGTTRLRVTLVAAGKKPSAAVKAIADSLERAGFQVDVVAGQPAVIANRLADGRFDLAVLEWPALEAQGLGAALRRGGPLSYGRFSGPEVMAAVHAMERAWEPAARARLAPVLAQKLITAAAVIPIAAASPHGLVSRRLDGIAVSDGWIDLAALSLAE